MAASDSRPEKSSPFWPTGFSSRRVPTSPVWHSGGDREALKRSEPDRLYFLYKLRNDWLVSEVCSQVLGREVTKLSLAMGKERRGRGGMMDQREKTRERKPG